jgi:hypothetical protein
MNRNLPHAFEIDITRVDEHNHEFLDGRQVAWNDSHIPQYLADEESRNCAEYYSNFLHGWNKEKYLFTPIANFSSFLSFCTETLKRFEEYCLLGCDAM